MTLSAVVMYVEYSNKTTDQWHDHFVSTVLYVHLGMDGLDLGARSGTGENHVVAN